MSFGLIASLLGTPPSRTYLLFISHAWEYKGDYEGVVNLLQSDHSFEWQDLSVQKDSPLPSLYRLPKSNRHICRQLDALISKADCLLVLDAMYAAHSAWIQSEIEAAQDFGKPIIAIAPQGQEKFPQAVRYAADARVGWNSASIINAIRKLVTGLGKPSRIESGISSLIGAPPPITDIVGLKRLDAPPSLREVSVPPPPITDIVGLKSLGAPPSLRDVSVPPAPITGIVGLKGLGAPPSFRDVSVPSSNEHLLGRITSPKIPSIFRRPKT